MTLYILLAGGPNAPGVEDALRGNPVSAANFEPALWNRYRVRVVNPDAQATPAVEVPLM